MTIYLTYNDSPSGVYNSQVADTVNFLRKKGIKIRLVAMVSMRSFFHSRSEIKKMCRYAVVLPMFPGVKNWKMNRWLVGITAMVFRPSVVIGRGIFATHLGLITGKNFLHRFLVVFDARGGYYAEFSEYNVVNDSRFISTVSELEKKAIEQSSYRMAVSQKLVYYWREKYGFKEEKNLSVIPCTLAGNHSVLTVDFDKRKQLRQMAGYTDDDIVLIYSGSTAGWQSLGRLITWLAEGMLVNKKIKLIIMARGVLIDQTALAPFGDRVKTTWVNPGEVSDILITGDYGLLIREKSVTNEVSSPTKFAEYLAAGMKVIISKDIGDFSSFVEKNNCGLLEDNFNFESLSPLNEEEFLHSGRLADNFFRKENYWKEYSKINFL